MKSFPLFISSYRLTRLCFLAILCVWMLSAYLFNSNWNTQPSSLSYETSFELELSLYARNNSNDTSEWTVMAYLDGDNNVEYGALDILNELEAGYIPNQGVEIVALLDRNPEYDFSNGDWSDARIYHINADADPFLIQSNMSLNIGEINMGDPSSLRDFVVWAQTEYPANHYALVIYDHGLALRGVCIDDTSFADFLSIDDVQQALNGLHVDLLVVDGCTMAIFEVAYEWASFTDYIVFSETSIMIEGMDYNTSLHTLCLNPFLSPWEFGDNLAEMALEYYQWDWDLTYNVINCSQIEALGAALSDVGIQLINFLANDTNLTLSSLRFALEYTQDEGMDYFVDLGSMIQLFSASLGTIPELSSPLALLNNTYLKTIYKNHHQKFAPNATGLLAVFPCDIRAPSIFHEYFSSIKPELGNLDILNDPNYYWDDFLASYIDYAPLKPTPTYTTTNIEVDTVYPFEINASNNFLEFDFEVKTGHIYNITAQVAFGDVGVAVEAEFESYLAPRGYFYSNAQNPEQTSYEQIIYWFRSGFYVIYLFCWPISSTYGNTYGNISVHLCEPSQIETNSTINGTFPPIRTATMPILPIYSYYLLDLQPGICSFTINATPGISLFVNLWEGLHKVKIDTFLGQRNEMYALEYHVTKTKQILIEISAYEGSGEYCLKITSQTENNQITTPTTTSTTTPTTTSTQTDTYPSPFPIPTIIGIGSGGIFLIVSIIGIVMWKRRK